jgi:hypothetical protein
MLRSWAQSGPLCQFAFCQKKLTMRLQLWLELAFVICMTNDAQCLLQSPVLKHHSCQKHRSGEHWYVPCTECSSTSTVSQKFHLYCVHCCPGLRASHDFVNATHNTARQQLSQKWDCHLWKTKHERKMRKSTAHSFQTVKPQFQNCDGLKAVCFWIQIQVFGDYTQVIWAGIV